MFGGGEARLELKLRGSSEARYIFNVDGGAATHAIDVVTELRRWKVFWLQGSQWRRRRRRDFFYEEARLGLFVCSCPGLGSCNLQVPLGSPTKQRSVSRSRLLRCTTRFTAFGGATVLSAKVLWTCGVPLCIS